MKFELKVQWFLNCYRCVRCHHIWEDEWSSMCDDRCPICNIEMTPYKSVDLSRNIDQDDLDFASRRLPSPLWVPDVVELIQNRLER